MNEVRTLFPAGRPLFAVGEYYSGSVATLRWFIAQTGRRVSLFDFPLQFNFRIASQSGGTFDMRMIFDGTLVAEDPDMAVTFVDNHDTFQAGRRDAAVADGFRPLAYAMILLRAGGTPCLFYPDYRANGARAPLQPLLDILIAARRDFAYGAQTDYFDDASVLGWTRQGDADHPRAMAVVLSGGPAGVKRMAMARPSRAFADITGAIAATVITDADGWGTFTCNAASVSVWVEQ